MNEVHRSGMVGQMINEHTGTWSAPAKRRESIESQKQSESLAKCLSGTDEGDIVRRRCYFLVYGSFAMAVVSHYLLHQR
jgi:hypothetical protein